MTYVAVSVVVDNKTLFTYTELLGISWQFHNCNKAAEDNHIFFMARTIATNRDITEIVNYYSVDLGNPITKNIGCYLKNTSYSLAESEGSSRRGLKLFSERKQSLSDRKRLALRR